MAPRPKKQPKSSANAAAVSAIQFMQIDEDRNQRLAALAAAQQQAQANGLSSAQRAACPNKECPSPNVVDGTCRTCGRIADNSADIVAEVEFGEAADGRAMAHGQRVGHGQTGSEYMNSTLRRICGGGDSRERSIREAAQAIREMAHCLRIHHERIADRAIQIFKLALSNSFTQGRRMPVVHAVCLYLSCRSDKEGAYPDGRRKTDEYENIVGRRPAENQLMLIDFADHIQVNVFQLGRTFKALHNIVPLTENGWLPISPEDLIYRFASRLEFYHETEAVADTAVRLAKSMALDMMDEGRRPSGICGACLLMAARIHNFRRSVREVVYVVKVTMETIRHRMDEFRSTASSDMSIEQFLSDNWTAVARANPPCFYKSEYARTLRQRQRRKELRANNGKGVNEGESNNNNNNDPEVYTDSDEDEEDDEGLEEDDDDNPSTQQLRKELAGLPVVEYQRDERGRAIVPITSVVDVEEIDGTEDAVIDALARAEGAGANAGGEDGIEATAEHQANRTDGNNNNDDDNSEENQAKKNKKKRKRGKGPVLPIDQHWRGAEQDIENEITSMVSDPATAQHAKAFEAAVQRARAHHRIATAHLKDVSMNPQVDEDEFADDPEVANCLLSEEEKALKELIWVNENDEYLRKEQAKIFQDKVTSKKPKPVRKKRRKRADDDLEFATSGDAAHHVAKQLHISSRIDKDVFDEMFSGPNARTNVGDTTPANSNVTAGGVAAANKSSGISNADDDAGAARDAAAVADANASMLVDEAVDAGPEDDLYNEDVADEYGGGDDEYGGGNDDDFGTNDYGGEGYGDGAGFEDDDYDEY